MTRLSSAAPAFARAPPGQQVADPALLARALARRAECSNRLAVPELEPPPGRRCAAGLFASERCPTWSTNHLRLVNRDRDADRPTGKAALSAWQRSLRGRVRPSATHQRRLSSQDAVADGLNRQPQNPEAPVAGGVCTQAPGFSTRGTSKVHGSSVARPAEGPVMTRSAQAPRTLACEESAAFAALPDRSAFAFCSPPGPPGPPAETLAMSAHHASVSRTAA